MPEEIEKQRAIVQASRRTTPRPAHRCLSLAAGTHNLTEEQGDRIRQVLRDSTALLAERLSG